MKKIILKIIDRIGGEDYHKWANLFIVFTCGYLMNMVVMAFLWLSMGNG